MKKLFFCQTTVLMAVFSSSPIAKCSQVPLIHQVRAFSISKCSILLYLTLWDQHNMILRARKVVPSSTKPKSVDSHSLADLTGMDEAFTAASCRLCPSVGSYHPRDSFSSTSIPSSVSRVYSLKSAGAHTECSRQRAPLAGVQARIHVQPAWWQGSIPSGG